MWPGPICHTSCGGRTIKLRELTDAAGCPPVLLISSGSTSGMTTAPALIEAAAGRFDRLIADGYDSNAIPRRRPGATAEVVIPPTTAAKTPIPYNPDAYRTRNLVERL